MSVREKAVKGVAWSTAQTMGGQLIALAVFVVLARLLEPSSFGLIAISSAFIAVMELFLTVGFNAAIIQRDELEPGHLDTAFWIYIGLGLSLCGLGVVGAGLFADLYNLPELGPVIRWLSVLFLIHAAASVQEALLRRKLDFRSLAIRTLVARVAGGVTGIVMAFQGFGVWSLVGQQLVGGIVQVVVLWTLSDWRPGLKVSVKHSRDLFSFGMNVMASHALTVASRRMDDFLIGYFLGPVALGYYAVAYRLVRLSTKALSGPVQKVAFPVFSRMQRDPERLRRAFYAATRMTMLIALPGFLALIVLAPEVVPVVFGEKWADSIPVMQILALMGVVRAIVGFNADILVSQGKPSWKLIIQTVETVVMVGGFIIAVSWGIVAVALARVITGLCMAPVWFRASQRLIGIEARQFLRNFMGALGGSVAMLASIYLLKWLIGGSLPRLPELVLYVFFGGLVYILALRTLSPKLVSEAIELLRSLRAEKKTKGKKKKRRRPAPGDAA